MSTPHIQFGHVLVRIDQKRSKRLVCALENPAAYDHPVARIERIETHISWVLLTGGFAYKIKKPVDLGFADFSSLDKRRHYCKEELRLNRRLCPELYRDVVPITGTFESPRMNGAGTAIEYAVRMTEFSQDRLLCLMIERGELTAKHIDRLAKEVADFHASIPCDQFGKYGTPEDIWEFAAENFRAIRDSGRDALGQSAVDELYEWSLAEFQARRGDFENRKAEGFVRECHGDMHLGNMIADGDDVLIFDCIEFNDRLRWIDVMSEAAFVVMDLEDRGRAAEVSLKGAFRFLNAWLERTGDYPGLTVLPFYLVYRALVRAKVAVLRLQQNRADSTASAALLAECRGYLEQARCYAHRPHPRLSITHGVSGSGKTTGTQQLVEETGTIRIRSDVERKRLLGLELYEPTSQRLPANAYSAQTTQRTYGRLLQLATSSIQAGYSVVIDATFLQRKHRDMFHLLANKLDVPFQILHFDADVQALRDRISRRIESGNDASEADLQVLEQQLATQEPLEEDEREFVIFSASETQFLGQR